MQCLLKSCCYWEVGRGIISFSLPDITSRDKQNWAMANKTHLNWRNKKMQKPKKKPNKAASRIEDLHEHWLVDNAAAGAAAEENSNCCQTCPKIALGEATHGS
jgi:hypothetical protein